MILITPVPREGKSRAILIALFAICILLLQACNEVNTLNKPSLSSYTIQGKTYLEQHQFKAAITAAKQAIKSYPESIEGYLMLAEIYHQLQQPELTLVVLQAFSGQKNSEYYFLLLSAYQNSGQLLSASQLLVDHAALLSKQGKRLTLYKAQLNLLTNQLDSASLLFKSLEDDATYSTDALLGKARIMIASDDIGNAMLLLDEIIISVPKSSEAILLKSELLINESAFLEAENLLSSALSVIPSSDIFTPQRINVLMQLSQVLTAQGRTSEALFYARALAEEHPDNILIKQYYQHAISHYEAGRFLEAKSAVQKILTISSDDANALALFAAVLYQQGEYQEAQKYIVNVISLNAKLPAIDSTNQLLLRDPKRIADLLAPEISTEQSFEILRLYLFATVQSEQFDAADNVLAKIIESEKNSADSLLLQSYYHINKAIPENELALKLLETGAKTFYSDLRLQAAYLAQLLELQKYKQAEQVVAELIKKAGDDINTQLLVGNYQLYNQQYLIASRSFEQTLALSKDNVSALYGLAKSLQLQKKYLSAQKKYEQIVALAPQQFTAYQGCVNNYFALSKNPQQLQAILPAEHDPALLALALVGVQVEQYKLQTADQQLQIALSGAPRYLMPYAKELKRKKDHQQASQALASSDFSRARVLILDNLKSSPNSEAFLLLLAKVEIKSEHYNEAEKILMQIETILPNNAALFSIQEELKLAKLRH